MGWSVFYNGWCGYYAERERMARRNLKYLEVYKVSEIQTEHIQGFLNSKTESCSQLILSLHNAQFRKLEKVSMQISL